MLFRSFDIEAYLESLLDEMDQEPGLRKKLQQVAKTHGIAFDANEPVKSLFQKTRRIDCEPCRYIQGKLHDAKQEMLEAELTNRAYEEEQY